jgi:hypothetical protein
MKFEFEILKNDKVVSKFIGFRAALMNVVMITLAFIASTWRLFVLAAAIKYLFF